MEMCPNCNGIRDKEFSVAVGFGSSGLVYKTVKCDLCAGRGFVFPEIEAEKKQDVHGRKQNVHDFLRSVKPL